MIEARILNRLRCWAIALSLLCIGILHYVTPDPDVLWHSILQHLYVLPIAVAAIYFGWRGGLAAGGMAALCLTPHILITYSRDSQVKGYLVSQVAEMIDFFVAALVIGILADRERKQKQTLERASQRLSAVYQELQDNFERMKRSERLYAIGQLAAGLAHEIRNPLASIAGAVGILGRKQGSEEKRVECLEIINKECQRLNSLLASFLDFAKPRVPKYQTMNLGPILDSVVGLAAHAIDRKPIVLRKQITPNLPPVECDPEQLKQALLNLIINAVQAMPEGGEISVSAAMQDGKAVIGVSDQGYGISSEHLDNIFDPFFTTKEEGTGLGLSVAHQIVRQHGGILTAEKNWDRGMTFSVLLPLMHRNAT